MTQSLDHLVLTVSETARLLRLGRTQTYELIRSGAIPSIRLGRAIRIPRHQLAALLGLDDVTGTLEAPSTEHVNGTSRKSGHRQPARQEPTIERQA